MKQEEIVLFWSGGKDSALALYKIFLEKKFKVKALLTTINKLTNTVPFHGVNEQLILEQSKLIGVPLHRVYIPDHVDNKTYTRIIEKTLAPYINHGISKVAFGDIHLEDIRKFREIQLKKIGLEAYFPLWGESVESLRQTFHQRPFRAVITSVMSSKLPHDYLGKELSAELIGQLPQDVDPFGEGGEFHTLVTFAPYFKGRLQTSISITKEEGPYQICQVRSP